MSVKRLREGEEETDREAFFTTEFEHDIMGMLASLNPRDSSENGELDED